ncbi:LodA/GoxA family CTQ-dependent oxidase [Allosphingosinicella deserti]|uniref:L-lysine 6-oxidase n=1 Tax=Allosphingosinicella deserti TaxID=2116704 RepID=A0A2P7QYF8_9SPHN|nr:LodA/GoxA family CTQ-dependent oxidase [Sphingomonas deserti]PSJ42983.1 hypothetical protein C7I55_00790 [Sphingomonas deserti]
MGSTPIYRIHPGIGIARLGDSPDEFCISPEGPAQLPIACDAQGNGDVGREQPIQRFKDAEGRIKRNAARFQIWVYDEQSPDGRPLKIGDPVAGGGNQGVLADIQWRVHLSNKKASWYEFNALQGEAGYPADARLRNADITDPAARQQLIIDAGPQTVDLTSRRRASFSRGGNPLYADTFPPKGLRPHDIDTLGEILTDDSGRLLVLGGHGRSGSYKSDFGQPRIDHYANTDGWFDDISDGPVMARLVIDATNVGQLRYVDVEYPAWVLVGYPRYAPEVLDMITLDDVVEDLAIREFADRPDMFGAPGSFSAPQRIDPTDRPALLHWKAGRREWNEDYRPWFWRDIWTILVRPDEHTYFTNILQQSNFPHNQSKRGTFDPYRLCIPPRVVPKAKAKRQHQTVQDHASGLLFERALEPAMMVLDASSRPGALAAGEDAAPMLAAAALAFVAAVCPPLTDEAPEAYALRWQSVFRENETAPSAAYADAEAGLDQAVRNAVKMLAERLSDPPPALLKTARLTTREEPPARAGEGDPDEPIAAAIRRVAQEHRAGILLQRALDQAVIDATADPAGPARRYLFDLLRKPGEENVFVLGGNPSTRTYHLPLMPLLAGDNPISNETVSKFLRLTDTQLFLLRQWAEGKFIDEVAEGWVPKIDPWRPYEGWTAKTGRDLDRGVLSNLLGGAFCPGGEVTWIIRNPAIWREPYRLKADPGFAAFRLAPAQENANRWGAVIGEEAYVAYADQDLSQGSDYDVGLQPGDLTKTSGLPWQADFNECSTQTIDVTYTAWNAIDPTRPNNSLLAQEQRQWETLWWPVHRPMQVWEAVMIGGKRTYEMRNWSRGVSQTLAGDLKMVTEWSKLGFVIRNPYEDVDSSSPDNKYISVERSGDEP